MHGEKEVVAIRLALQKQDSTTSAQSSGAGGASRLAQLSLGVRHSFAADKCLTKASASCEVLCQTPFLPSPALIQRMMHGMVC